MKNESNIYDIDGNIIRKAGDNHRFTIEEIEKLVDELTEKVQQNPDNQVYRVYLNNAHKWLYNMYSNMSTEELTKRISTIQDAIQKAKSDESEGEKQQLDTISEAMDELKREYEAEDNASESDLTEVLESTDKPTVMESNSDELDEYVEQTKRRK